MTKELYFRRHIRRNDGTFLVSVPPDIVRTVLGSQTVDFIVRDGIVCMLPVEGDGKV